MKRIVAIIIFLACSVVSACADDLIDTSGLNMRRIETLNMGENLLPPHARLNTSGTFTQAEAPEYDLPRMIQVNPDFVTYPSEQGIIWLKHVTVSRADDGGTEITRLYVILGRHGLASKWLNWNIQTPAKGSAEVLEATVYDFPSGTRINTVTPEENTSAGIKTVRFMGLPDTFIIALSWREHMPEELSFEGLCWLQDELRVWESIVEIYSPELLAYKTFPDRRNPDVQKVGQETLYMWRRINVDPFESSQGLARLQRAGVAFSTRRGNLGLSVMLRDLESMNSVAPPAEAVSGFKRSESYGISHLVEWLKAQPEIELADGTPRRVPSSGAWTKREKLLLAKQWLTQQLAQIKAPNKLSSQKTEAALTWRLPFDPDDNTPICAGMFYSPVLAVAGNFYDMNDPRLLGGTRIFGVTNEATLVARRIPSSKSGDNRLSAVMDYKVDDNGMLNGTVRVILRGAWPALMLGNNPTDGSARGAILSLFPGLTNYKNVKYKNVRGTSEISFTVENKPGIGGSGRGVLAILPFFEPSAVRALGGYEAPVELKFPFVIDQNVTLGFPRSAKEALLSGKTAKNPDKINYSESYQNRRHRLVADSRFELDMQNVSAGNMPLLRRCLEQWRVFSSRNIPVR